MLTACVHILQGAASSEVGCIIMRYFIHISVRRMLIQEQAHQQYSSHRGNKSNKKEDLLPYQRREWGFAPLCGAIATFSGYSKDPSRLYKGRGE